jgi:hypothetical protein
MCAALLSSVRPCPIHPILSYLLLSSAVLSPILSPVLSWCGAAGRSRAVVDEDLSLETNGLPCWILTAGSDSIVRCWDLERPMASHTVLGLDPGETRHVYQVLPCRQGVTEGA